MLYSWVQKYVISFLFERHTEIFHLRAVAGCGPGLNQGPSTQSGSPMWVIGTEVIESPSTASEGMSSQGARIGREAGTQTLVHQCMMQVRQHLKPCVNCL